MRQLFLALGTVLGLSAMAADSAVAQDRIPPHVMKGTVLKYSQPIGHLTPQGTDMRTWGENIPSDVDWHKVMQSPTIPPNWVIADDFRDRFNAPVTSVRWWGSYGGPTFQQVPGAPPMPLIGPGSEDGYVISFFRDIPVGPNNNFSRPGELLGTYALPLEKVWIEDTPYIGWDKHRIYEYKANLMDAHLDHAIAGLSDPMGFHQKAGEIYWISIMAEVGHKPRLVTVTDPDGTVHQRWDVEDTGKFAEPNALNPEGHFWGWHTSPVRFQDIATMGHLAMPGNQWEYFGWNPIRPQHELLDMAFELYTPEPNSALLMGLGAIVFGLRRRRVE